jgi:hypothetical protein
MTVAALLLGASLLAQGHGTKVATGKRPARSAETPKRAAAPAPAPTSASSASASTSAPASASGGGSESSSASDDSGSSGKTVGADGKTYKSKTYSFGAMDVEGKLKTPQLLYFLNRVKLELDMSAPDTRSFMKELEKSADDKNL